ncbi:SprB repeat-containing protein, partial [Mesonia mobilis]|uniref:SprB repeat-containing protein n=1 Tax=Mesonia mobilis TaxID=369791 RepID=UPI0026F1B49F
MSAQSDDNADFEVEADLINPSSLINNGIIELTVEGGTPPYTYKWSNKETPLSSSKAEGLTEGVPYTVVVQDSDGNTATVEAKVKAEAITEKFNGIFTPAVEGLTAVLFWDPFAAIGIYDPIVYADVKNVETPGWSAD